MASKYAIFYVSTKLYILVSVLALKTLRFLWSDIRGMDEEIFISKYGFCRV